MGKYFIFFDHNSAPTGAFWFSSSYIKKLPKKRDIRYRVHGHQMIVIVSGGRYRRIFFVTQLMNNKKMKNYKLKWP